MLLSVVIVNFNTNELLRECLISLLRGYGEEIKSGKFEIIVVDNASNDGSTEMIKQEFEQIKLLVNRQNTGFAKANNLGIKKTAGHYVLLLNPDTVVPKKTLTFMVDYMDNHPHTGVSTCKVLLANGEVDDASHRGFPTPWRALTHFTGLSRLFPTSRFFNGYHLGYQNMDRPHEIDAGVGAFLLIRRSAGQAVGWLDEDYFWYGEDLDLCYKIKQNGYRVMYVPTVEILHHKGAASGIKPHSRQISKADQKTRLMATQARFEAMRIFYQKHYRKIYPQWLTAVVLLGIRLKKFLAELTLLA